MEIIAVSSLVRLHKTTSIVRNPRQFMKSRRGRGCNQAQLALTDLTQLQAQPGMINLHERGSQSGSLVQALPKTADMIGVIDIHDMIYNRPKIQHIAIDGEIREKTKNQETQDACKLTIEIDRQTKENDVKKTREDMPIEQARGLEMNLSELEIVGNILAAKVKELRMEITAFGKLERKVFLREYTRHARCLAWNVLNFMKSDHAVDLAQWLDYDCSRITALTEICGGHQESDVKSSLLEIFDCVPATRYTDKTSLLNDLLEFRGDMHTIQDNDGIPAHSVGHAAMVLANAEAISRRFPFPLQLRCGAPFHYSVRAVAGPSLTRLSFTQKRSQAAAGPGETTTRSPPPPACQHRT